MIHNSETLLQAKERGVPLAMVTAYTAFSARLAEKAGVDLILVGDSAANVVWGYDTTRAIGMEEMLLSVGAVARSTRSTHIVADLPWKSDLTPELALANSQRFFDAGAHSVKLEMTPHAWSVAEAFSREKIPFVPHLGLLPQTAVSRKQHIRTPEEREELLLSGRRLEEMGALMLVVEHVPDEAGEALARSVKIPVIGIGAGPHVDGQVLVFHDLLGLGETTPPIARQFVAGGDLLLQGMKEYIEWVLRRGRLK